VVIEQTGRLLPFSCEQVFDLAADIEHYPDFLRGWITAHVRSRESNICYVDQVVGIGPLHVQFSSKAVLLRPVRIDVTSSDPPFRHFSLSWLVEAVPSAGCRVSVVADLQLQSIFLQQAVDLVLPDRVSDIIESFEARARHLYSIREAPVNREAPGD
jgi:coenzyme Q-binding protein COQ10